MICPHCRSALDEAPDLAGQVCACPRCGGQFVIPGVAPAMPRVDAVYRRPHGRRKSPLSMLLFMLSLAGGGVMILLCGVLAVRAGNVRSPEEKPATPPLPPVQISAEALAQAWADNSIRADDVFQGVNVAIEGDVFGLDKNKDGQPVVVLNGSGGRKIVCVFRRVGSERLHRITNGERVKIRGVVQGHRDRSIVVGPCELLDL